ncbi:MAG: hypothetical protein M3Y85_01735, partial [Bacteroidota bacterium]|nr:hypothetical protein [Bacteroidota bacterium]
LCIVCTHPAERKKQPGMKVTVRVIQIFVAVLFIISGLVKANDPLGLSYKMQEFFELWGTGFGQGTFIKTALQVMHKSSLALSIGMITLEILAGIALLIGWKKKAILWLLLLLIIFFTFLTGYAYLSGKFTNCGCFGDCLPITPLTSFLKDITLLAMIIFLIIGQRYIAPVFSAQTRTAILMAAIVVSLGFQWYVLNYLPIADCLPFKKGANIPEQMKPPPGSVGDSTAMFYVYEKGGKKYEWAWNQLPADYQTYKYVDRVDKVVRKGNAEPPIKGFSLSGSKRFDSTAGNFRNTDSTMIVLDQPLAVIGFGLDSVENIDWLKDLKVITAVATLKKIPVYFATNEREKFIKDFADNGISIQVFATDFTVIRTAARTNPTFYILEKGRVAKKYGYRQLDQLAGELKKISP